MAKSIAKFSVHLDAMRAMAALTVFFMHGKGLFVGPVMARQSDGASGVASYPPDFTTSPAHEAVIVFFVLSGFFVGGAVLRGWQQRNWNWKTYAIQRLTRLWIVLIPALLLTLVLDTVGMRCFGLNNPYGRPHWEPVLSRQILSDLNARTFCGCLFFLQRILVNPLGSNGALWTLAYEFWFYLAFPLLLGALSSQRSWPVRLLNAALLMSAGMFVGRTISAYFLLWLLGAALQLVPKTLSPRHVALLAPSSTVLLLAVSMVLWICRWDTFLSDVIEACVCAGLCYVLLHQTKPARLGSFYERVSRHVSDMSYTLYLTHLPILVFLAALLASQGITFGHDGWHLALFAASSVVTLGACYILYLCFEQHNDRVRRFLMGALAAAPRVQTLEPEVVP